MTEIHPSQRQALKQKLASMGLGNAIHLIEQTQLLGDACDLEGCVLIEHPDGTLRRINGPQLAQLAEILPYLKDWRLDR
ncbi:hypothetical protein [Microvirga sp. 2TAF3]|uniref:hypothetical protein n=1 Tax=Microvirga sp. 2TAF3 TaxID=3233014 RepID=UPI003F9C2D9B